MAKSINQVILMGRLTRDPELRTTTTGKSVVNFSLAVDKGGQDAGADFFEIVAWEKLAELVAQYLSKGRRCLVQGRLSQRQWEQDGPTGNSEGASAPASQPTSSEPKADAVVDDEIDLSDIPF